MFGLSVPFYKDDGGKRGFRTALKRTCAAEIVSGTIYENNVKYVT